MTFFATLSLLIIVLAFITVATFVVLIFGLNLLYVNLTTQVPWAKVPAVNLEKILAEINLPKNSLVYDLGSGDGRFLFLAEKKGLRAVGYELALYPYLKTIIRKFLVGSKITTKNKDFFKTDLSKAEAIFIFLTASVMGKIGMKLKQNLKPGIKVISYGFKIPGWPIVKILETSPSQTYIYLSK